MNTFKMAVSHQPKHGEQREPMWFGHRIGISRLPSIDDERKAIERFAKGKRVISQWETTKDRTALYKVFKAQFINGKYFGRASSYHYWRIVI